MGAVALWFAPTHIRTPSPRGVPDDPRHRHGMTPPMLARGCRAVLFVALLSGAARAQRGEPVIGLITKTATNPFFVKMKEGADSAARSSGVRLISAAGKIDGDNAAQATALENM